MSKLTKKRLKFQRPTPSPYHQLLNEYKHVRGLRRQSENEKSVDGKPDSRPNLKLCQENNSLSYHLI